MKIYVYQDLRGEFRWRLVAENGRIMADGAEGYVRKGDVFDALDTIETAWGSHLLNIIDQTPS